MTSSEPLSSQPYMPTAIPGVKNIEIPFRMRSTPDIRKISARFIVISPIKGSLISRNP
jgi:hypothetical protein